jgi:hypothetical protein
MDREHIILGLEFPSSSRDRGLRSEGWPGISTRTAELTYHIFHTLGHVSWEDH